MNKEKQIEKEFKSVGLTLAKLILAFTKLEKKVQDITARK
jgi:hypothetical protein